MRSSHTPRRLIEVTGLLGLALLLAAVVSTPAYAFSGRIDYSGALGPITSEKPLCLCVYTQPDLRSRLGCLIYASNDVRYTLNNLANRDYYVMAFVDLHINERRDADEPFVIFENQSATPGDPLNGHSTRDDIDFVFGDENLATAPTPTGTEAPQDSPTPTATPDVTPTGPSPVAGDCNADRTVSVNELVLAVSIALESAPLSSCPAADRDADGMVRIDDLIAALNAALAT